MQKVHQKPEDVPKYRGVTWDSTTGMWRCRLMLGGEHRTLGWFPYPDIAARFYDKFKTEAAENGFRLQRKTKTNVELKLLKPPTDKDLATMAKILAEAMDNKGRSMGCFFPQYAKNV